MESIEYETRILGRKNMIRFRNTSEGVIAYLPDGVSKRTFQNWKSAYQWALEVDKANEKGKV